MHTFHSLLALLLAVVLRAAAQTFPIIITPPETIVECEQTIFTWWGGNSPYSFYYGAGHKGSGNDEGVETETLVMSEIVGSAVVFYAPASEGLPWRFRVADATQNATIWMYIQPSNACGNPESTFTTPQASTTQTLFTTTYTLGEPPSHTSSSPTYSFTTIASVPPGSTTQPGSIISTTTIATTTKQTNTPANPTTNPPDPNTNAPSGSGVSSGNPPSGSSGTNGTADGSASSGDTRTPNEPTGSRSGTNGGAPTQTAPPFRNTESEDSSPVPMSAQALGTIIGTITGAFVLFITFLCFRWRKRHQKKHRPVPVLPRIGNSEDDITTAATPPYEYSQPMRTNEHLPMRTFASQSRPVPSPPRVLPSSKQAMTMAPLRSSVDFGSEASSAISAGTWRSEHDETSWAGSASAYPEDEEPPPMGHSPATSNSHERYLRPTAPPSMPPPLSLQQLIGQELYNLLSSPDRCSPDTPLYTPTSLSARDHPGRFRVANDTEQFNSSGGVASTSKHPYALTEELSSQQGERARRSPELIATGGGQRQRVPISRHEMEYLADLVAARITRDTNQRTEQTRSDARHGPPPSYV